MGVYYLVEPYDDEEREWLEAEVAMLPKGKQRSRNPTPSEIRQVLDALDGFKTEYNVSAKKKIWQAMVQGTKGPDKKRWAALEIEKWGGTEERRYKLSFEKGDPEVVVRILHGLSAHTGPLLVAPDSYPPMVV